MCKPGENKSMIEGTSFITRSRTPKSGPAAIATHMFLVGYRVIVDDSRCSKAWSNSKFSTQSLDQLQVTKPCIPYVFLMTKFTTSVSTYQSRPVKNDFRRQTRKLLSRNRCQGLAFVWKYQMVFKKGVILRCLPELRIE